MNTFTKQVFGFNYQKGMDAVSGHIQGDSVDMNGLIDLAADKNGMSPEDVKELVGEYLLN